MVGKKCFQTPLPHYLPASVRDKVYTTYGNNTVVRVATRVAIRSLVQPMLAKGVLSVLESVATRRNLPFPGSVSLELQWRGSWVYRYRRPAEEIAVRVLRQLILVLVFCVLVVLLNPAASRASVTFVPAQDIWSADHVAGDLLVGFHDSRRFGASPTVSSSFATFLGQYGVLSASPALGDGRAFQFHFAASVDLEAQRQALLADPAVAFAEPNYLLQLFSTGPLIPNDENYKQQWAFPKIGADLTWNTLTTGGPIVVAILDSGASPTHPDLKGQLIAGYDFIGNDPNPNDDNGHGTFTAGIVAAASNNTLGVTGMAWGAKVMPIKILDQDGRGPVSAFAQGIRYAVDQGAQVINVSAGIPVPSQTMEAAVTYAIGKGRVITAASGNQGDTVPNYPAAYQNVIAVSATTREDRPADFSSYGPHIWIAAPGKDIVSTYYKEGDTYAQLNGTSASTPYVAGTVALMLSQRGDLPVNTIREILKVTAVDIDAPGFDSKTGYGRLDTFHAVLLATDPPATLGGAVVTPTSGKDSDAFVLTASGLTPGEPVTVWITAPDGTYRYFSSLRTAQAYATANGTVQLNISTNEPLAQGRLLAHLYGEQSRQVATANFEVKASVNTRAFERVTPVPNTDARAYFPETGHTLSNVFLRYWQANGGLAIFGFPISEEFTEISKIDNKPYTVQYFERNRFEYHPEHAGDPYEVLLGLLGNDLTTGRKFDPAQPPYESTPTRAYFPETKHTLSAEFLQYWQANGGLAVFGYPLSEPFMEVSKDNGKVYLVQYFERNRFELHPENTYPYNVLLGRLGVEIARNQGYIPR